MNCTIERTEEEIILRFPADTDYAEIKKELDRIWFLETVAKIEVPQGKIDEIIDEARTSIGKKTESYLADKPGFEHLGTNEEE